MDQYRNTISGNVHGTAWQIGYADTVMIDPPLPVAVNTVPSRSERFVGRQDVLATLDRELVPGSVPSVCVVSGPPGVGKTELAIVVAHELADRFPGGVLYLDLQGYAREPVTPEAALSTLLTALGVGAQHLPHDRGGREVLYRGKLADCDDPKLIVLDNASSAGQVRPLLPGEGRHQVLVTSRDSLADLPARKLELDTLAPADAVELISQTLRLAREEDERAQAPSAELLELARLCDHLPLALSISAAILVSDPIESVADLAAALTDESTRLRELEFGDDLAVRSAFDLSYRRLSDDQARLFRSLSQYPGTQISTEAVAAASELTERQAKRLLASLRSAHLIVRGVTKDRIRLHDLLRLYALELATEMDPAEERTAMTDRLMRWYVNKSMAADNQLLPSDRRSDSNEFASLHDALQWLDIEAQPLMHCLELAEDSHVLAIAHSLVRFFELRKHWDDWRTTAEIALETARRNSSRHSEACFLAALGHVHREMYALDEADEHYRLALPLLRELGDDDGVATVLANLGNVARERRDFDTAFENFDAALSIVQKLGYRSGEAGLLINIGRSHLRTNDLREAHDCFTTALQLFTELGDVTGQGYALSNLGLTCYRSKDLDAARENYLNALRIATQTGDRMSKGIILNNLATLEIDCGEVAFAANHLRRALTLFQSLGAKYNEAETLGNLAVLALQQGDVPSAEQHATRSAAIYQAIDHGYGLATALAGLMLVHASKGDTAVAAQFGRRAAALFGEAGEKRAEQKLLRQAEQFESA